MKIYIATSWHRKLDHNYVRDELARRGHVLTFDWTLCGDEENAANLELRAAVEASAISAADVVVVLLPGRFGTHAELGMAVAAGVPVYITAPADHWEAVENGQLECIFYHHPVVRMRHEGSLQSFVGLLVDALERGVRAAASEYDQRWIEAS